MVSIIERFHCITIYLRHHHGIHSLIKASYTTSLYTNMAAVYRNLILQAPKNMPHPPVLSVGGFLQSSTWPHESATRPLQWAPCLIKETCPLMQTSQQISIVPSWSSGLIDYSLITIILGHSVSLS